MTDRPARVKLDDLNSDQLDELYAETDRLTAELTDYEQRVEQLTTELRCHTGQEPAPAICELPHQTITEEDACEEQRLAALTAPEPTP